MNTVTVGTKMPYDVHIGPGLIYECGAYIAARHQGARVAVVTDNIVDLLYSERVFSSLAGAGISAAKFVFKNGEAAKTLGTVSDIYSFLSQNAISRDDLVVALGGGVVGDVAGFAAATFLRGVPFVQLPTTLLSAVDSSVGGKTGVNIPEGKNLVGAFWQPSLVLCDTDTLATLSPEILADGAAEVLKYGALYDRDLFLRVAGGALKAEALEIITRCVKLKRAAVQADERDTGARQLLNFGHTIGHAIEAVSGYTISHGRAVAAGMAEITARTEALGFTKKGATKELCAALESLDLPTRYEGALSPLCPVILGDKKRHGESISFVILNEIGSARLLPVAVAEVEGLILT